MAERYAAWAWRAIEDGYWIEAEAALERAGDFADVSSDLSYLLALARSHQNRPQGAILEALGKALETGRWNRFTAAEARLMQAESLIRIRAFSGALQSLASLPESGERMRLRLLALRGLEDIPAFRTAMAQALERYPRSSWPLRLFFTYSAGRVPGGNETALMQTALQRLPVFLDSENDSSLACLAVPFIRDTAEARRILAAYLAKGPVDPAALPQALNLGLMDEGEVLEELFSHPVLDKALILSVWGFLGTPEGRDLFRRNLLRFSGVITEDADKDGYPEARIRCEDGQVTACQYDDDQDGLDELEIAFSGGIPLWAKTVMFGEPGYRRSGVPAVPDFALPVGATDRQEALILWEQYPAVLRVELGDMSYIPHPAEFSFRPVSFEEFGGIDEGFLFPVRDSPALRLTRRSMVSFSAFIQRPSREFSGAVERVEMKGGIPQRASEILNGRAVSATEFRMGRPYIQRIDLDLDGRMETVRRFRSASGPMEDPLDYAGIIEYSESDWNGDGIFEYGEEHFSDGSVVRSFDFNGDGIREYTERSGGALNQ